MKLSARQLEAFIAIIECQGLTRAAERLNVSQPAVSRMLERFQHEIGFKAFKRSGSKLVPTAEGTAFYHEAKRYYSGLDRLNEVAQDLAAQRTGNLRIGVFPGYANEWIATRVADFLTPRPKLQIVIEPRTSSTLVELVVAQRIDLAITTQPSSEPEIITRLMEEALCVCLLPPGSSQTKKEISPADLSAQPMISVGSEDTLQKRINRAFNEAGVNLRIQVSTSLGSTACHLVAQGLGATLLPEPIAREYQHLGYSVRPFTPELRLPIFIITARNRPPSGLTDQFLEHLSPSNAP